jgi:multisubunit Na+/H+ antiporter MnhB subunit
MMQQNILRYRDARYAWWAIGLGVAAVAIYATQSGRQRPGGGTWQGYVLGAAAVLLIVWLALLGVRKRRYRSTLGSVQAWTSAHVWLGLTLLLVATLHCAGRFGGNVHTLAYALMCIVIGSGIVGVYTYLSTPRQLAANSGGRSRPALFAELFELDRSGRELARACDPEVSIAVRSSIERTSMGGGVWRQLLGVDRSLFLRTDPAAAAATVTLAANTDQQAVIDHVARRVPQAAKRAEVAKLQALVVLLCRRQAVLRRIRQDIRLHAWLRLWLYVHVPLTFALLAALIVHILTTFMYW